MYEEEKKNSFIKDFVIKLLYMFLFLFLFMWLYPAPKVDLSKIDLSEVEVKVDKTELQPLFAGIYNDNINSMKESARSYYTVDRLPKNNGESSKMTLQEMLNKKIVAPFVDANGKSCDSSASYVEVTRISATEYTMKVSLSCSDKKDYIIETIGCTSVCPGCVAAPTTTTTKVANKVTTTTPVYRPTTETNKKPTTTNNNSQTQTTKIYKYEKINETWTTDSSWTEEKKNGNDVKIVNTRTIDGDVEEVTRSYTYRTVSYVSSFDNTVDYSLYLNNIPRDAKNVRIISKSKMTSPSDLRSYINNRYSCVIQMVGSSCPSHSDANTIENNRVLNTPLATYNYSLYLNNRYSNRYMVNVSATANNYMTGDQQYIIPIKFTVQWTEEGEVERIKQYQYSYLKKTTETKYSQSKTDTSLLNDGYKLVGEV